MLKRVRFYLALSTAFIRRDKQKVTYIFIGILLVIFAVRVLVPSAAPKILEAYTEFRKPTFVEGAVGNPEHPNPLFDSTQTQKDISNLIFRSLMKVGSRGELVPDLAEKFEKISDLEYVFTLRDNVFWHDGKKFTSNDVVYTVKTAQNPKFESPLAANFKDVTVEKQGDYKVKFTLEEAFTPFPFATSVGIVPEHISLKKYKPVGTGPFVVKEITKDKIVLSSKKLNIVFKFYMNFDEAKTALKLGEIHALGGLSPSEVESINNFGREKIYQRVLPFRQVVTFFNTRSNHLKERGVRQALNYAIDKELVR
ncbi:ABC transporter substrate-binding protein, partial [Patescibacteria group bacterium]|nr:ABC transporter substrate-binding protein [Patescibacteria group bacterium]